MGCQPQRVTAYVDRELSRAAAAQVARHLAVCLASAAQASFELDLSARLRALPGIFPGPAERGGVFSPGRPPAG